MSRDPIALTIPDLSDFARRLRSDLDNPPSHLEMLGHIARAAGFRNYQHLRARLEDAPVALVDTRAVDRAQRHFDARGLMLDWPGKTRVQSLCLWVIWAQLPARTQMSERQISQRIDTLTAFRDAAQIRRAMVEHGQVTRERDGSIYTRVEQAPPPEAQRLISRVMIRA